MSTADIGSVVASIETIAAERTIRSDAVPRESILSYQARRRRKFFNDFSRVCARTRGRGAADRESYCGRGPHAVINDKEGK